MANKQDSNLTGLRYAEEESLKTLPSGSPIFYPLEPNSYSDFGGQLATVARRPISATRQRKKGTTTDLDASGGFNQDLTMGNLTRLMQGFFFSDARQKTCTLPLNGTQIPCTAISTNEYQFGADPGDFAAGDLIVASGFGNANNNGLKLVASSDSNGVTTTGLVNDASPLAGAKLQKVGVQSASGDLDIALSGSLVQLTSTTLDFTTLGLVEGEWIYIGGDAAGTKFANNQGFARIALNGLAAHTLTFDKVDWATPAIEDGAGKTIQLFFGTLIRNEPGYTDIVRRTYHLERQLGEDDDGTMSEYLVGAVPNEFSVNLTQADKVTCDLSFVACDNEQRTGLEGLKTGTRPTVSAEDAINTTNDIHRIRLSSVDPTDATVTPMFAYATDVTLTLNNGVTPNKAIGVLGAFDVAAGTFEVGGQMTVYFADVAAMQAVRNNADVTLDFSMTKDNKGILFDVPLLSLGDARLNIEQDQAITLPLETAAAESAFGYTLASMWFDYLPDAAM